MVFLGLSHLFLFLFLGLLLLLLFHGLFPDVSGLLVSNKPVKGIILGGKFSLHFLLRLLNLRLMLAQLYLGFIVFELSFGLRLFVHFELVVHFVRSFMSSKGSLSCLKNLRLCFLLLVHCDSLLLGRLLHSLILFLLLDGFIAGASLLLLLLLRRYWRFGHLTRIHFFVCYSVIFGCLFNLGGCLVDFLLLRLSWYLVLLGFGLSNGLILGIIVRLLSINFVFACADLRQHPRVILPSVIRLYGEPNGYKFNITTQRRQK